MCVDDNMTIFFQISFFFFIGKKTRLRSIFNSMLICEFWLQFNKILTLLVFLFNFFFFFGLNIVLQSIFNQFSKLNRKRVIKKKKLQRMRSNCSFIFDCRNYYFLLFTLFLLFFAVFVIKYHFV